MSRKQGGVLVLCIILLLTITGICSAAVMPYKYCRSIKLIPGQTQAQLNYQPVVMEHPAYIKDGCTLVPFRFLADALGARVTWNPDTRQAKLRLAENQATVCVGSKTAYSQAKLTTLDVVPEIKDGCLYVPLRFMTESLGACVNFESQTNSVTITCVNPARWIWELDEESGYYCLHPDDWKMGHDDKGGKTTLMSPNGSLFYLNSYEETPDEYYQILKKEAQDNGLHLIYEKNYASGNRDEGFELHYTDAFPESGKHNQRYYLVDPYCVGELLVNGEVADLDAYVARQILMNVEY